MATRKVNTDPEPVAREPSESSRKDDKYKPRYLPALSLFPLAIAMVSQRMIAGQRGPDPRGFMYVPSGMNRYAEALARHLVTLSVQPYDATDEENWLVLANIACNALILLETFLQNSDGAHIDWRVSADAGDHD